MGGEQASHPLEVTGSRSLTIHVNRWVFHSIFFILSPSRGNWLKKLNYSCQQVGIQVFLSSFF
ncbi:MAG: hypothetical protein ACK559_40160, partial [bacterium]